MTPIDPVALTAALIRCPSVTPADGGALDLLAQTLGERGFTCTPLTFAEPGAHPVKNLYARIGTGGRHFCFAGHTDVVPPGDAAQWRHDPFAGVVADGFLFGRGAVDMKGAVAAFTAAVSGFLADRGGGFDGSISLLITGDEEGPGIDGTAKVLEWLDGRGERIDACLVGEPTSADRLGDMVKIGRRGSLTAHLTVSGVQGHVAYPERADNPVHRLALIVADLIASPVDEPTAHFGATSLQVSTIDVGNPASNVIPAVARATLNLRFNDRWTGASLEAWLRGRIAAWGGKVAVDVRVSGESFITPPADLADLIAEAIQAETGQGPVFSTTGGTSDARFIRRVAPVAEFGLVGRTMHQVDEAVRIDDLLTLTRIYRAVLDRYFPVSP